MVDLSDPIPDGEREGFRRLQDALTTLAATASTFSSTIRAYEEVNQVQRNLPSFQERAAFWREHGHVGNAMAQRGAMLIYDFYRIQQRVQSLIAKSAWISGKVDRAKLKLSNVTFARKFPHFAKLRNAAAHHAEHTLSDDFTEQFPEDNTIHGLNFGARVLFAGSIINGNYVWTIDNQHLSYEVSAESAAVITLCYSLFEDAFEQ